MENIFKNALPADVTQELITLAVTAARRWHKPAAGMYTLASAIAAGWRGQPMHKECRPADDGVGGNYYHVWDGGEVRQRTRSCPSEAGGILAAMWDEYDRQTAAGR